MSHKFIYSALLLFITGFHSFSQSKKEQIEVMMFRLDSLNIELQNQKTLNSQMATTNTNLTLKIDSLEALNKSLNQEKGDLTLSVEEVHDKLLSANIKIDSLRDKLSQYNSSFQLINECYENCTPKDVYHKSECSQLNLEYIKFEPGIISEENTAIVNKIVQMMMFEYNVTMQNLDYSKKKNDEIKSFVNDSEEFYVIDNRYVSHTYLNPKMLCLDLTTNNYFEDAPRAEIGQTYLVYNLLKKKILEFNDIFLPNTENQIKQLLIKNIEQLISLDNYEDKEYLANLLPESGNIDDFDVDFENVFISNECEGILSGKLTELEGIGFHCGPMFSGFQIGVATIPFSQCSHLLTPEFLSLVK
jgi:hypothetical protein